MMLAATRWKKKAAEFQAKVERDYTEIRTKPTLRRVARIESCNPGGFTHVTYAVHCPANKQAINGVHSLCKHRQNIRIVRMWEVWIEPDRPQQRWERLVMARAHRDGLEFHYARWLMTRGTRGVEYA